MEKQKQRKTEQKTEREKFKNKREKRGVSLVDFKNRFDPFVP